MKYSDYIDFWDVDKDYKYGRFPLGAVFASFVTCVVLRWVLHIGFGWLFCLYVILTPFAYVTIFFVSCLVSYPFRLSKIKRLISVNQGKCFSVKTAGTILGWRVYNGNTNNLVAHDWDKCTCLRCGEERQHDWNGCKCERCGQTRDERHDWELTGTSRRTSGGSGPYNDPEYGVDYDLRSDMIYENTYTCKKCRATKTEEG